ncbi:MAG TPA: TylF/MycF/NovP-related O-methyltransferase [Bryobacteraceae bacterium]|nr:TylF/MycF/NovP-related O-methyltransferase [Bryobacteraceae bacterium]
MLRKFALVCVALLALIGLLSLVSAAVIAVKLHTAAVTYTVRGAPKPIPPQAAAEDRYLELLKRVLTRYGFENGYGPLPQPRGAFKKLAYSAVYAFNRMMAPRRKQIVGYQPVVWEDIEVGRTEPVNAETMIGLKRLDNIQFCVTDVLRRKVPGDLIECGAWRGGACIFMRAILAEYGVKDRVVWVADSFEGLPKPDEDKYPELHWWSGGEMAVSLEEVQNNFRKYGLLDEQVKFLKGFFVDTLPKAPIQRISVLRVDGNMYESVTQTLQYMYPKVSVGGYIILDDYGDHLPPARTAVDDYRKAHGITAPIERVDYSGAFWRKER